MSMTKDLKGKYLGLAASTIAAVALVAAMSVSNASPRHDDQADAFPGDHMTSIEFIAASKDAASNIERFEEAAYGVDQIVTGPVSKKYKQQRVAAGCDQAVWPNVPKVCYPN